MLRVRELAATGVERSSVKTGMTGKEGAGNDRGRGWRQAMETGEG